MKISLEKYNRHHWFEDKEGNVYGAMDDLPKDIDYFTYHCISANTYSEPVDAFTYHPEYLHENNTLYHMLLQWRWFYNFMFKRMKKRGDSRTFKRIYTGNVHYGNGDCIVAMVNSGDYTLPEAIYVYCNSCERCTNVLENKYLGQGYAEHSEEWERCNTSCEWCKDV